MRRDNEERLEALMHAFVLALIAVGVLIGLAIGRFAEMWKCP